MVKKQQQSKNLLDRIKNRTKITDMFGYRDTVQVRNDVIVKFLEISLIVVTKGLDKYFQKYQLVFQKKTPDNIQLFW